MTPLNLRISVNITRHTVTYSILVRKYVHTDRRAHKHCIELIFRLHKYSLLFRPYRAVFQPSSGLTLHDSTVLEELKGVQPHLQEIRFCGLRPAGILRDFPVARQKCNMQQILASENLLRYGV